MTNEQIVIENLTNIFNAVHEIKNDANKSIYSDCGHEKNVHHALMNLSQHKKLKKNNMSKIRAVDDLEDKMALISQELNYTYRAYPPLLESIFRLNILFAISNTLKIDLEITYNDIEKILAEIIILKQNYIVPKRPNEIASLIGDARPQEPYYLKEVLSERTKLTLSKIEKFFEIFAVNYKNVSRSKINMFIEVDNKYFWFYSNAFAYDTFRIMEEYLLRKIKSLEIDKYYKLRGEAFEQYCESCIEFHFNTKPYKKLKYKFNNKLQEIDLLIEFPNAYVVIECKSSKFIDNNEFYPTKDILNDIKKSVGKGFKTLNTFKQYFDSVDKLVFTEGNKQRVLAKKKIYPLILTLSDLQFVAGTIQKYEQLEQVDYYPVSLSIMDFSTILKNATGDRLFQYFDHRLDIINNYKNTTFDLDEVDVYGYIMNEDIEQFKKIISMSKNIDFSFMIGNSIYRKSANDAMDSIFVNYLIGTYHPEYAEALKKVSRNALCPCGSGRKYKHCCGK